MKVKYGASTTTNALLMVNLLDDDASAALLSVAWLHETGPRDLGRCDSIQYPSQYTTPPEIPFRPLNRYGAKEASENECRIECLAGPIIKFSYSGEGNLKHVPTSSNKNLSNARIADSVPWFGLTSNEA